ncbi:MAG: polysaccharide biosynthesis tyrosine autokinase [Pirellulales bacterium]|nr:polysaccharide biosynthesis tyrosine autokinase [Pirellulales bacterium]
MPNPSAIDPQQPHHSSGHDPRYGALVPVHADFLPVPQQGGWSASHAQQTLAPNVTAGNILHSLRRKWWIGAGVGILCAIASALAAYYLVPNRQEVTAMLRVRRNDQGLLDNIPRFVQKDEFDAIKRTQIGLVTQRQTIESALNEPDPDTGLTVQELREVKKHDDPVGWLEKGLEVESPGDTELMFITLKGDNAKELAKIVNAISTVYLRDVQDAETKSVKHTRDDLERIYSKAVDDLNAAQKQFKDMADTIGVPDRESVAASHQAKLQILAQKHSLASDLQRRLYEAAGELHSAQVKLQVAKNREPTEGELDEVLMKYKDYEALLLKRHEASLYFNKVQEMYKDTEAPKVRELRAVLQDLDSQIEQYREEKRPQVIEMLKGGSTEIELTNEISKFEAMQQTLATDLANVQTEIQTLSAELLELGKTSPDLQRIAARIDLMTNDLKRLNEARLELSLKLTSAETAPRITMVAPAMPPEAGGGQLVKYMAMAFAAFFGLCMPVVAFTFWDFQQHRVNQPSDASTALGTKILGALPSVAGRKGKKAAQGKGATALQRSLADSVDGVRTALIRDHVSEGTRVVLVTSAVHHEGKTTLATQLATSLARAGKRTLLVDGDLRKPVAHRLFGLSLDPGFCEVLRGECEIEETIRPTRASGLWMMAAGRCDDESLHDLAKEGVENIFKQLRAGFDYVVIDASPVLATADALVIGQYVDGAVLAVLRDASRVPHVHEAMERLRGVGVRVIGTVFGGSKQEVKPRSQPKRLTSKAAL